MRNGTTKMVVGRYLVLGYLDPKGILKRFVPNFPTGGTEEGSCGWLRKLNQVAWDAQIASQGSQPTLSRSPNLTWFSLIRCSWGRGAWRP